MNWAFYPVREWGRGFIIIACIPVIGSMIEDRGWPNAAVAVGGAIVILFGVLG
jgi:hypothetical protein